MRLATIGTEDGPRAAVLRSETAAVPIDGYADVGSLFAAGEEGFAAASRALSDGDGSAIGEGNLLRPVLAPGAIVCVGLNYRTHILEMGRELPAKPTLFSKLPRALTNPFAEIELPAVSDQVDYEGELAVVIGKAGREVPLERAWEHVGGLTVLNDVTMRDFQRRTIQWFAGKTFEESTPIGPWVVTPDELEPLAGRELTVSVNGEERQRAPLGDLVFDVPSLVADLSTIITLRPGDVIATGTPGGVGEARKQFLADGDRVEVTIDGIGSIRNVFRGA